MSLMSRLLDPLEKPVAVACLLWESSSILRLGRPAPHPTHQSLTVSAGSLERLGGQRHRGERMRVGGRPGTAALGQPDEGFAVALGPRQPGRMEAEDGGAEALRRPCHRKQGIAAML